MTPKKAFIIISSILALTLVGGFGVYYLADSYLHTKAKEISKLKAEVDILDEKIVSAKQAISRYEELAYLEDIVDKALPPTKVQSDIVAELSSYAKQANLQVISINFSPTSNTNQEQALTQTLPIEGVSGVRRLPINVGLNGDFNGIIKFLKLIETNQRLMQVESVSLSPGEGNNLSANLIINVYVRTL